MSEKPSSNQLVRGLGLVVLVCIGVRIAAELVAPVLPGLLVIAALVFIISFIFR